MTEANKPAQDDADFDDALLERNLADIDDLPSFEVPPKGSYVLLASGIRKKINDHPAVIIELEVVSTVELVDKTQTPIVDGSKTGVMFMLDNEYGLGSMKKFLQPFAAHFGTDNVRELVKEKIQNLTITATMDHQIDSKDKTKIYARPKNIAIV